VEGSKEGKQQRRQTHLLDLLVLLDNIDRVPPPKSLDVPELLDGVNEDVGEDLDVFRGGGDEGVGGSEGAAGTTLTSRGFGTDLGQQQEE
jgi:hypothetical protein